VKRTNYNNLTDKELVEKVLHGNNRAFEMIIHNTERMLAQIVFKMINNPEDRKDIAQDIYVKAYQKLPGFRFQSKLSTWIAEIGYNSCLDYLRKKKLVLAGSLGYEDETDDSSLDKLKLKGESGLSIDSDTFIFQKDLSEILQAEIEKLDPIYKTLITLFHNEELSYDEIAQITDLPEGTIKSYLFRARKALKKSLLMNYKKEEL
jgi:RNA polymerase sigma-70 factor (ECF subfamily)